MERKFKHKVNGSIAYYKDGIFKSGGCAVEIGVEPSSEYWEEVKVSRVVNTPEDFHTNKAKYFELLELKTSENNSFRVLSVKTDSNELSVLQTNGKYFVENNKGGRKFDPNGYFCGNTLEEELENDSTIHSVKCLSDGKVFSVGDDVRYYKKFTKISSIFFNEHGQLSFKVEGYQAPLVGVFMENHPHLEKVLLVSEDESFLFGGESAYGVTNTFELVHLSFFKEYDSKHLKIFAKRENAEEYIRKYKNYTTTDGERIVEGQKFFIFNKKRWRPEESLFGHHINSKYDGRRYKTKKEVEEIIRITKPKYSLKDVSKALLAEPIDNPWYLTNVIGRLENGNIQSNNRA